MLKNLAGRRRSIAVKCSGLLRDLPGAMLMLCVVSATASAQDSAQSQLQDLDGLLNTPVSTGAKYAQDIQTDQVAGVYSGSGTPDAGQSTCDGRRSGHG